MALDSVNNNSSVNSSVTYQTYTNNGSSSSTVSNDNNGANISQDSVNHDHGDDNAEVSLFKSDNSPSLSMHSSIAEMQMVDYQNAQKIAENIANGVPGDFSNMPTPSGAGGLTTVFSIGQMQMVDYQNAQNISAQIGEKYGQEGLEYLQQYMNGELGEVSGSLSERSAQALMNLAGGQVQNTITFGEQYPGDFPGPSHGGLGESPQRPVGGLSTVFSIGQMQMVDYQNSQTRSEYMEKGGYVDFHEIEAGPMLGGLLASLQMSMQDEHAAEGAYAAAYLGFLDLDGMETEMGKDGCPKLSMMGELMLEAEANGTPLEMLPNYNQDGVFDPFNPANKGAAGSEADINTAQGLITAAQHGMIDIEALKQCLAENDKGVGQTYTAMKEIVNAYNNGIDMRTLNYDCLKQDLVQITPGPKFPNDWPRIPQVPRDGGTGPDKLPPLGGGEGNDNLPPLSGGMSTVFSIGQMQMVDYQNAQSIGEEISNHGQDPAKLVEQLRQSGQIPENSTMSEAYSIALKHLLGN